MAALRYLLKGKSRTELAEELRGQKNPESWPWKLAAKPDDFPWFKKHFDDDDFYELRVHILRMEDQQLRQQLSHSLEPPPPPPPPPPPWTVEELWLWWENEQKPVDDYILEGEANWPLFHGGGIRDKEQRKAELKRLLLAPETPEGKALWYRLFGYACLVSAGRTMTELRSFWLERLNWDRFWERTQAGDFSEATREIFERAVTVKFRGPEAEGEQAYFWRRVFYDIRKVHRMVEHNFPSVLLNLIQQGYGQHLHVFLRTGQLPGPDQPGWIGTFGQSADAPLGFIIRELFRLGVITDEAVRPHAFYVCRPVLRALEMIGWIGDRNDGDSGFAWQNKIEQEGEYGQKLLPYYDIPLLHMGIKYRRDKLPTRPSPRTAP